MPITAGIHHITAYARKPSRNLEFYTQKLGLKLVKKTVNFDDPGSYHLYYGDQQGSPGSLITFFCAPRCHLGETGVGQVGELCFRIPEGSLDVWEKRLGTRVTGREQRFGQTVLRFQDPDRLELGLTECNTTESWLGRLHSATLLLEDLEPTRQLLMREFGYGELASEGPRVRLESAQDFLDLVACPGMNPGRQGAGCIHHLALRAESASQQQAWQTQLVTTEVMDRQYFQSIYFREPGGVLLEVATDGPGFGVDEEILGQSLRLPTWLECQRQEIEESLPDLEMT